MKLLHYSRLLELLGSAQLALDANAGELNSADLRIRCLLNVAIKESQRAQRDAAALERSELPAELQERGPVTPILRS